MGHRASLNKPTHRLTRTIILFLPTSLLQPLSAEDDERVFSRFGCSLSLACYSLIHEMALRIHFLSRADINVSHILTRLLTFMFLAITILILYIKFSKLLNFSNLTRPRAFVKISATLFFSLNLLLQCLIHLKSFF